MYVLYMFVILVGFGAVSIRKITGVPDSARRCSPPRLLLAKPDHAAMAKSPSPDGLI
jgi:hypothetical protein